MRGGGNADPLSVLDDAFDGVALDAAWSVFDPAIAEIAVSDGELHLSHVDGLGVGEALWYSGFDGFLVYKEITGNFDARMPMRVSNGDDSGLPPTAAGDYRIAGLQAHDPDRASVRNYVHVGLGTVDGVHSAEWKTTVDNESDSGVIATGAFGTVPHATLIGVLRIRRVGSLFTVWVDSTQLLEVDRPDLPATLQVGPTLYSNQAVPDCVGHASSFAVTTPG